MKKHIAILILSIFIFFPSCYSSTKEINYKLKESHNGLEVVCYLNRYGYIRIDKEQESNNSGIELVDTIILGKIIIINNTSNVLNYDLRRYYLKIKDSISRPIGIDIPFERIILEKEIKPGEIVEENVYWSFIGKLSEEYINFVELYIK